MTALIVQLGICYRRTVAPRSTPGGTCRLLVLLALLVEEQRLTTGTTWTRFENGERVFYSNGEKHDLALPEGVAAVKRVRKVSDENHYFSNHYQPLVDSLKVWGAPLDPKNKADHFKREAKFLRAMGDADSATHAEKQAEHTEEGCPSFSTIDNDDIPYRSELSDTRRPILLTRSNFDDWVEEETKFGRVAFVRIVKEENGRLVREQRNAWLQMTERLGKSYDVSFGELVIDKWGLAEWQGRERGWRTKGRGNEHKFEPTDQELQFVQELREAVNTHHGCTVRWFSIQSFEGMGPGSGYDGMNYESRSRGGHTKVCQDELSSADKLEKYVQRIAKKEDKRIKRKKTKQELKAESAEAEAAAAHASMVDLDVMHNALQGKKKKNKKKNKKKKQEQKKIETLKYPSRKGAG